jgi:hypothetical protein
VLGTQANLALYYLGFGFVIVLGWAAIADELNKTLEPAARTRMHRLAVGLALAGLVHPAFALAGRDIAGQLGRADGPIDPMAGRAVKITTWGVVAAMCVVAVVIASHLGRFDDAPILQDIRDGLPFA